MRNVMNIENQFPSKSIILKLIDKNGHEFEMANGSACSHAADSIRLILIAGSPFPMDRDFVKVMIKSENPIKDVKVIWHNYSM